MLPPCGTDMSSAAPSKARSGTAITSASGPIACVAALLQPATRTLHTFTSLTMASAAARETTKTGTPAGWSARSTKGSRDDLRRRIELERAPPRAGAGHAKGRHQAEIALGVGDRRHHACGPHMRHERHREAEMEAGGIAHRRVPCRQVGVDRERRL